jgi:hypothetical protein
VCVSGKGDREIRVLVGGGWMGVVVNDGKDGILGDREVCAVNFVVW